MERAQLRHARAKEPQQRLEELNQGKGIQEKRC
jgi:hypothetical protein